MFAAPKNVKDSKLDSSADSFSLTIEQQKQLDELVLANEKLNKEKNDLEIRLKQVKDQIFATTRKIQECSKKPDTELAGLLLEKMPEFRDYGVSCHANLVKKVIAIKFYPVEDLEAVKKAFYSFVDPKAIKISGQPLDGVSTMGGPCAYLEIDMRERANLLKGLQLAQANLDIPQSSYIMKC